jgi:hypothetical protein
MSTKIWVVGIIDWGEYDVGGVFSSEVLARQFYEGLAISDRAGIEECLLDEPGTGVSIEN